MILMQSHSILGAMDEWSVSSGFEYGPGGGARACQHLSVEVKAKPSRSPNRLDQPFGF